MNAAADNFTAADLRKFEAKKHGLLSFEAAESFFEYFIKTRKNDVNFININRKDKK